MVPWVGSIREGVADDIKGNGHKGKDSGGIYKLIAKGRAGDQRSSLIDQVSQAWGIHRKP